MHKFVITFHLLLFLTSCGDNPTADQNGLTDNKSSKVKQTLLITSFKPAFLEHSTVVYSNNSKNRSLSILINCNRRTRSDMDTLFYKTKLLTQKETEFFDTTIIRMIHIPIIPRKGKIVDGIGINFELTQDDDLFNLDFQSPSKSDNPVAYIITSKAISSFKDIFNDEIISNYFDDIKTYLDDSIPFDKSKERAIYKLRQKKYGR